ncbi:uncharacterized protein TNCT_236151 [Trichonephila clavata]|uniref:Uncharacterized protein n=1 Tax=Trichonephila clavata TaxID=2740835 RepID=A0A8X6K667_TRICU|nr:uncharacterized protein TNCT_236151 [Trichonephila clavata]
MRNVKKGLEPNGFAVYWKAINEIKLPTRRIGNKKLVQNLEGDTSLRERHNDDTLEWPDKPRRKKKNTKRKWKEY